MAEVAITFYGCDHDEAALIRQLAPRYGIVPVITDAAISVTNTELAAGNRCISINHKTQVTRSILRTLSEVGVEYISTRSAGQNHIDVDYAKSLSIAVGNVAYSPDSVADYALMLMLMAVRNTKPMIERVAMRDFRLNSIRGRELRDMTVGVVGTGHIGAAVIDRLQGFGCQVLAYDRSPKTFVDYVSLDELLQHSDIVTLHTPLNAETHHLLNSQRIKKMKNSAFVINTGRGALVDTEALITALDSGKLAGAALDVIEKEEGIFYSDYTNKAINNKQLLRLQELPGVIITPHAAYYTDHALRDMVEHSIINCLKFEKEKV